MPYVPITDRASPRASAQQLSVVAAVSACMGALLGLCVTAPTSNSYVTSVPAIAVASQTVPSVLVAPSRHVAQGSNPGPGLQAVNDQSAHADEALPSQTAVVSGPVALAGLALLGLTSLGHWVLRLRQRGSPKVGEVTVHMAPMPPQGVTQWTAASAAGAKAPIYVVNGFYMSMREKYTQPGAAILWMCAEWDSAALSWKDFRGKLLGATDPATAPEGSIRRTVLQKYQEFGLQSEPNVGDNGVHASASPFEGLVERMNWIGAQLETDEFGKALLKAGIPKDTIMAWTKDPQVEFEGQKRGLFDVMEDLNVQDCLKRAQAIAGVTGPISTTTNRAFLFVKPHAMTPDAIAYVQSKLQEAGISVTKSGRLDNVTISEKMLIDNHYYAIANKASLTKPKDLSPPADKQEEFATLFGEKWADVLSAGRVYNALDACAALGVGGNGLDSVWGVAKKAGKLVKFGGGFYVGQLHP